MSRYLFVGFEYRHWERLSTPLMSLKQGQSAGRYKLQKSGCNRIFPISINENLLKQICEICSVSSTHMLTKIGWPTDKLQNFRISHFQTLKVP